jgi:two-component system, response regulator / RNA-binding antiterminator
VIVNPSAYFEGEQGHDLEKEATLEARNRALRIGLLEAGYNIIAVLPVDTMLADHLQRLQPDMIIVDDRSGARDALEQVVIASRDEPRPIVLFTDNDDPDSAREAIKSGVSAYIVQGLQSNRVRSILEVASARFEREQALREELMQAKNQLRDRQAIDEAKRILMKMHGLSEDEAYARLRRGAMDQKLRLAELAQKLIAASALITKL